MRPAGACIGRWCREITLFIAASLLVAGCGSVARTLRVETPPAETLPVVGETPSSPLAAVVHVTPESSPAAEPIAEVTPATITGEDTIEPLPIVVVQAPSTQAPLDAEPPEIEQYDPWEPFNEKMFTFNLKLDKYVLKPVARVYRAIIPEPFQILISNGFDNLRWPARFVNSLLQGKFSGAGREMARFLINSTAGVGGLFDPAKDYWGIRPSKEDFGQTLGVWGYGPGPYLILPFLPPLTVRDGIGYGVDGVMDPLSWYLPFFWARLGMKAGDTINDRALNYDLFQGVEETTIDLYSSVRHFYLQRREKLIKE